MGRLAAGRLALGRRAGALLPRTQTTRPQLRPSNPLLQSGEHVKVIHGAHEGETGMVVRVEQPVAYVFTDASRQEIRVFLRDLTLAVATASAADS